jgi:hypothetical protein
MVIEPLALQQLHSFLGAGLFSLLYELFDLAHDVSACNTTLQHSDHLCSLGLGECVTIFWPREMCPQVPP